MPNAANWLTRIRAAENRLTTATANFSMGGFKITSGAAATAATDYPIFSQVPDPGARNLPSTYLWANADRMTIPLVSNTYPFAADGREVIWMFTTTKAMSVTTMAVVVGGTPFTSMTHATIGILDTSRTVLAISTDNTTATWTANAIQPFTISYSLPAGTYFAYLVCMGTTKGNLVSNSASSVAINLTTAAAGGCGTITTSPWTPAPVSSTVTAIANATGVVPWLLMK